LTVSVLSAAKPGAASPVIITDEIYTDEAAIHLSLLQDRVVTFADPDVEAAVRSKIEHGPGDIMLFDGLWLADLSLDEVAAEDLGGLENLASLRILWLDSCGAIDLSPLSGLTRLTELKAASNGLTDISPLGGLTNLYTLDLQNNSITNLQPLSRLTKLIRLNLAYNQITDIYPLVENTEFGLYDTLYILGNTGVTGDDTQLGYIATLRTRGVTVYDQIVR
jgi:Leucine-rich repeat (LRR) protein